MVVVAIYRDEAVTGTISSRPGFQGLIADSTNPDTKFHTILVWKLSRFARNKFDSVTYEHMLEKRGVKVISVTEPIDDSPAGEMLRGFSQALDAYYSATSVRKSTRTAQNHATRILPKSLHLLRLQTGEDQGKRRTCTQQDSPVIHQKPR